MRNDVSSGFRTHLVLCVEEFMRKDSIEERIREIAAGIAAESNLELVQVETAGSKQNPTIRVFIDKPNGVSHEDCVNVSRQIEAVLDSDDSITPTYMLEVSSPGLERELYSLKDFEKFAGNLAKVKTVTAINGQKHFRGRIIGIKGEEILFNDKTNGELSFPFNAVAKANLEIDLEAELKRNSEASRKEIA
ncbi:ribosome maturation factor RimP [soil metagenome]